MSQRHKKRHTKTRRSRPLLQLGELSKPAEFGHQVLLFFAAFGQSIVTWALIIVTGFLQIRYLWIPMNDFPLQAHALLALANLLLMYLYLKSPVSKRPAYEDLPLERIDFSYVFRFQWRFFFFAAALVTLNLIPALYFLGTYDRLASVALTLGLNPQLAKALAWIGTTILSGIIGNLATIFLLGIPPWLAAHYSRKSGRSSSAT